MMTRRMFSRRPLGSASVPTGFTLIEVLVAVVILATGLLALAALQSTLARNAADARARSQVASFAEEIMERERVAGYDAIPSTAVYSAGDITSVQNAAAVSGLSVSVTSTTYDGRTGTFVTPPASPALVTTDPADPQFKLVTVRTSWNDASGQTRSFETSSAVGPRSLSSDLLTLVNKPITLGSSLTPVVRESNPAGLGMIPIAIGSNQDTATTNPKPELGGTSANQTLPATTFNVLTYQNNTSNATSIIQKRVETTVVECSCSNGANGTSNLANVFNSQPFRPTYWDGNRYSSPVVDPNRLTAASGPYTSGGTVTQSDQCTECCRDHRDAVTDVVKYDPFTGDLNRYVEAITTSGTGKNKVATVSLVTSNGALVAAGPSDPYLDACRVIRVDGLWRVAADMNAEHMGLLKTTTTNYPSDIPAATSWLPDPSAAVAYGNFVIDYLGQRVTAILSSGSPPVAATVFDSYGLNAPTSIDTTTTSTDNRFLNGRSLYLDHLEQAALDTLNSVNSTCAAADKPGCLLPYLPFNAINVTELANWTSSAPATLTITNASTACVTGSPIRGCVNGKASGTANANVTMGKSNSAAASSIPVSPYERNAANQLTDAQKFNISGTSTAGEFLVALAGLAQLGDLSTNNDPSVQSLIGSSQNLCTASYSSRLDANPNPYDCVTSVLLNLPVQIIIGSYNLLTAQTVANPCAGGTGTVSQPTLVCNTITGVSVTGYTPTWSVSGAKTQSEQTTIAIPGTGVLPASSTVNVTFGPNGTGVGSYTCDAVSFQPIYTTPTSCQ